MISLCDLKSCCGCTACASACPKHAIKMIADAEGFFQPIIDSEKCIECGLCRKSCPIITPIKRFPGSNRDVFAIQNKNSAIRKMSPSGGFFSVLASSFIDELSGIVSGAAFDECFRVKHSLCNDKKDILAFSGSKYVQSDVRNLFPQISSLLREGKFVLFSGTPCQIHGLKSYLRKPYVNLLTVELVCHGVPSPLLWENYKIHQEMKFGSSLKAVNFRHKKYGFRSSSLMLRFENGKQYNGSHDSDYWLRAFTQNHALRWSCYTCPFKGDDRAADFTIYDGWHIGMWNRSMNDDKGTTVVLLNSNIAKQWFDKIRDSLFVQEIKPDDVWMKKDGVKMYECSEVGKYREHLYHSIAEKGYSSTMQNLFPITVKLKIKVVLKRIFGTLGIMSILGKIKSLR